MHCDETDHDVRLAAEENINKLIKVNILLGYHHRLSISYDEQNLKETHLPRVQVELHRIIKRNPNVGPRALKGQWIISFDPSNDHCFWF